MEPSRKKRPCSRNMCSVGLMITDRLPVVMLPGVLHIVGIGNTPVPVDDRESQSLRVMVETGLPLNTDEAYTVGQQIRVVRGPWPAPTDMC